MALSLTSCSVLVFCGSSTGRDPAYMRDAARLGTLLGQRGYELVYGGGVDGLMGAVSGAVAAAGAPVHGVMLHGFRQAASYDLPDGVTEVTAANLMSRKETMMRLADSAVVLPGGIGTFDELWEIAAAQDLRQHEQPGLESHPVVVLNTNGYYNDTIRQWRKAEEEGFIKPGREKLLHFVDTPEQVLVVLDRARHSGHSLSAQLGVQTGAPRP